MSKDLETVKQLIGAAQLKPAMDLLKTATQNIKGFEERIVLIESRYSNYIKILGGGMIDPLDKEYNRIASSLLDMVVEAGAEENTSEDAVLKNVGETLLLTPIPTTKFKLYYKRFKTGQVFEMQVAADMNTRELKNRLVLSVMPKYLSSSDMQEVFDFDLVLDRTSAALPNGRSLRENGVQENDTVYLRKFFIDDMEEEE
ncbi:MAG: hypothetical protein R3A50_09720 [Saprospiraceae bacterium]